ncbi:MAG: hypothetical protein RLZZ618_1536 [Pseudomonadota bacterium]|jgi:DNA ligase-associated metallophosphoesterase
MMVSMTDDRLSMDHPLPWPGHEPALQLLPERALFETSSQTLFVADVHLGKDAVFRARGVPVPEGSNQGSLARLSQALTRTGAQRLVVLGDFLHAKESLAASTLTTLRAWRDRHLGVDCVVVEGNHDRHVGRVHDSFGMRTLHGVFDNSTLRGVHDPDDAPPYDGRLTLAGHVHPVVRLSNRHDSLRLPCFWLHNGVLTLPAFGEFTGGRPIDRHADPSDQFFVISDRVSRLRQWGG